MAELRINFEYLCAFVPPSRFSTSPKTCWVVVPDFRAAAQPHTPVLLYDHQQRNSDGELPGQGHTAARAGATSPKMGDTWAKLELQGEQLEIEPDGSPLPAFDSLHTDSQLEDNLRIGEAIDAMKLIDRRLIEENDTRVAARLLLRQGGLVAGHLTPDKFGVYRAGHLVHSQQMAQQMVYTKGFTNFVDIVFRKIDGSGGPTRLRLKPNAGGPVVLTIRNCEPNPSIVWKHGFPPYDDQLDNEINMFFELSNGYDPANPPPLCHVKLSQDGPQGICAPKSYDGWA